ncbi:MAG TPA: 30S ribosomal protein S12 methylthiotransferase RimO [Candidatus Binatia bacterium]|nr:MAG: ribosomal protein S12 methylthiotransferase RimO [Planctomycetes bacterium RBG_16_55_9]HJX09520.1 30S ribosomal protein S12 methylthiotransferase RimO [Candidatus Binatia bacterium]
MGKKIHKITVGFISLGCPKNVVDSERMLAEIVRAGLPITTEPYNADVVVINTCGFIAPAQAESLDAIRHAVDCKRRGAVKKVVVAGCLGQRLGAEIFDQVDEIDAVVSLTERDNIAKIIKKVFFASPSARRTSDHYPISLSRASAPGDVPDDSCRLLITPNHWAYLRISEGCSRLCSFCTIPAIRGRFRSKSQERILAEANELVSAGVIELNVIAQDTTNYGRDLKIKNGLSALVGELEKISGLTWIRLMYLYPAGIDDVLIETIARNQKTVHYLDIPIQHVSDGILKSMRRPDTADSIRYLIEKIRSAIPYVVLRTTLMVGFPGETDKQFDELMDFVKWARFDALGCFPFYRESGTIAAEMPGQIPKAVKQQRLNELMTTQQKIAFARNENKIGRTLTCLVDSVDRGPGSSGCRGRYYGQAPDIDSVCLIRDCPAQPGQFIETKVVGTQDYDLIVEPI